MEYGADDHAIIALIRGGDKKACTLLVQRYQQKVFQTCIGFLHDENEAQDLTQDIMIKVCRSMDSFKGDSSFSTWLYRITVNMAINQNRKLKLRSIFRPLDAADNRALGQLSDNSDLRILRSEQKRIIRSALSTLTTMQRKAFVLSNYQDLPNSEVAEIMGLKTGAVESLIFRARMRLQEVLKKSI